MDSYNVITTLNELIETSKDGEDGFRTCAANVKRLDLRQLFEQKAARCREGAEQLQKIVRELGGDPAQSGSTSAAIHRFWVTIKGTITGMDDRAILAECERGEANARAAYEDALRRNLPDDVQRVVERQYREVQANHERIRELRDTAAPASA